MPVTAPCKSPIHSRTWVSTTTLFSPFPYTNSPCAPLPQLTVTPLAVEQKAVILPGTDTHYDMSVIRQCININQRGSHVILTHAPMLFHVIDVTVLGPNDAAVRPGGASRGMIIRKYRSSEGGYHSGEVFIGLYDMTQASVAVCSHCTPCKDSLPQWRSNDPNSLVIAVTIRSRVAATAAILTLS